MKLNESKVVVQEFNDEAVNSFEDLIQLLLSAKDLVADVYVNSKLLFTASMGMSVDNGYMIACLDEQFALTESVHVESVLVNIRQSRYSTVILSSNTLVNELIDPCDYNANIYFKVTSIAPECTTRCFVPESKFSPLFTHKIKSINLNDQPSPASVSFDDVEFDD